MKTLLWLDDCRDPHTDDWLNFSPIGRGCKVVWVKSYTEFVSHIVFNGLPDGICFDHDLGEVVYSLGLFVPELNEKTGMDCAKWLVDYCLDFNKELPPFASQSANPSGRENILALLNNFKKHEISNK